ncbi:MAG: DUF370 domain-containing protein [Candidatus Wallbacteria bacterium]
MYLHIGDNKIISTENVMGIFSLSHFLKAKENVINYKRLTESKKIKKISSRKSKSLILMDNGHYIESSISVMTLSKRIRNYNQNIKDGVYYERA